MPQDSEPNNGLGYYSCGLCSTYSQVLRPVVDEEGVMRYDSESGLTVMELDQEASSQEIREHFDEVHSDD